MRSESEAPRDARVITFPGALAYLHEADRRGGQSGDGPAAANNRTSLIEQIRERFAEIDAAAKDLKSKRLELGRLLLELKKHVRHGDWATFYRESFPGRSLRDAQKCMKLAGADDPEGAAEAEKRRERERSRERREAEKRRSAGAFDGPLAAEEAVHPGLKAAEEGTQPDGADPLAIIKELWSGLSDEQRAAIKRELVGLTDEQRAEFLNWIAGGEQEEATDGE